jgi:hypothetical protein
MANTDADIPGRERMLSYLKALAARLFDRHVGGLPPTAPDDPYVGVREPRKRGPGGKSTAVALAEPSEQPVVRADGDAHARAGPRSRD